MKDRTLLRHVYVEHDLLLLESELREIEDIVLNKHLPLFINYLKKGAGSFRVRDINVEKAVEAYLKDSPP